MAVIRRRAPRKRTALILPDRTVLSVLSADLTGSRILYRGQEIFIPLPGPHQVLNTITAVEALNALSSSRFALPPSAIAAGIAAARFPARLELLRQSPPCWWTAPTIPMAAGPLRCRQSPGTCTT